MRLRPNASPMSDKGESSSLFLDEERAVQMRRRPPVPRTQMGPTHLRSNDKKRKPAVEWAKAILICVAFVSSFLTFAWYRRSLHLQRKSANFQKLDKCDITTYPLWKIGELQELNLSGCGNIDLPNDTKFWSRFTSLKKIDLNNSTLSELPDEMRVLTSLEILFLSENNFHKIPNCIQHLSSLRVLSLRGNSLKGISAEYLPTSSIVWLILTNNQITHLHSNIGEAKLLRKLMLSHNKLTSIPQELGDCKDLELIRLADNNIDSIPKEVMTLPKLAWISLSNNPIASKPPKNANKIIKETDLQMQSKILGSGASGVVHKAKYDGKDVAVKIFKQQNKGSDGNAADEASINGLIDHPLAVSALGVIEGEGAYKGMVMDLLSGSYSLGKVPSFDTVTRDEGPAAHSENLTMDQVLSVVWNIASVLDYIHTKVGVSHSDVYLHNVLRDGQFVSRLSDWGASFVYNKEDSEQADMIERIEVLAFGRLVQDLFKWHLDIEMPDSTETTSQLKRIGSGKVILERGPLYDLMSQILQPDQASRPSFHMITEELKNIPDFTRISKQ